MGCQSPVTSQESNVNHVPYLEIQPIIDGDLSEWKTMAFNDGTWDLKRVTGSDWYEPKRNRLTVEAEEDTSKIDLEADYYLAWDESNLYLGAEVTDNINDVTESKHAPKRWYYKDAIAWFIEAPRDTIAEKFGAGDHGFAFVIDTTRPDYGAWWRHGSAEQPYIEEPLGAGQCTYALSMRESDGQLHYVLEVKINMASTLGVGDAAWSTPKIGDVYSMMIVHCDPDGGEYGGHLLIYGKGDDDSSWMEMHLAKPVNE